MLICHFPGCDVEFSLRNEYDLHHIKPVSMGGNNKPYNLIPLCPSCHRKVFVPGMKAGHHSIEKEDSIIIYAKLLSTSGIAIEYSMVNNLDKLYYIVPREAGDIISYIKSNNKKAR